MNMTAVIRERVNNKPDPGPDKANIPPALKKTAGDIVRRGHRRFADRGQGSIESLKIHFAAAGVENTRDQSISVRIFHRKGHGFECGHADKRDGRAQHHGARGGEADPLACERTRPDRHAQPIEFSDAHARFIAHFGDHLHYGFRVAFDLQAKAVTDNSIVDESGRGTGAHGGIEG